MERVMNAGYSQDAADADNRIAGCNQDGFGILDGIEYAWCRACFAGTNKEHILDFVGAVTFDHVFLEVEHSCRCLDMRCNRLICHRKNTYIKAEMETQVFGDLTESFPLFQQICTVNMGGKVAVTEQKPIIVAIGCQLLHGVIGIIANAPTMCFVNQSSQGVDDDIDIG